MALEIKRTTPKNRDQKHDDESNLEKLQHGFHIHLVLIAS
jgi:hypothetical protein